VGVPNYRVGDAAHESSPCPAKPPAPHHYQADLQLLSQVYNGSVSVFFYQPDVGLRNLSPHLLDLLHLLIEYLPAPLPKLIDYLLHFHMGRRGHP
jgi:hypothetical protein